jgi:hypothetical protein
VISGQERPVNAGIYREFKSIDGKKPWLWGGLEYRVTPGEHRVVFEEVRVTQRVYEPMMVGIGSVDQPTSDVWLSDTGQIADVTHGNPMGILGEPVRLHMPDRETRDVEFKVRVEAGDRYVLDGYQVRKVTKGDGP